MKNFKKILSATLAVLMIMSAFVFSASAKNFEDVPSDHKYAEQIGIIADIGVTVGTSDTEYSPEVKVTREQMALLLYRPHRPHLLWRNFMGICKRIYYRYIRKYILTP